MEKKIYGKAEWQEFRNEVLDLVILYHHVKEYSEFDKEKIEYIKSFFHLSKKQGITAFFIKVGFLLTDGTPTLKNFLSDEDYNKLIQIYNSKVKLVRDKLYAHNAKSDPKMKDFVLTNDAVEEMYAKIISSAEAIDKKYTDQFHYGFVANADGIKTIEPLIDESNELDGLKSALIKCGFQATVKMDIMTGKIKIVEGV